MPNRKAESLQQTDNFTSNKIRKYTANADLPTSKLIRILDYEDYLTSNDLVAIEQHSQPYLFTESLILLALSQHRLDTPEHKEQLFNSTNQEIINNCLKQLHINQLLNEQNYTQLMNHDRPIAYTRHMIDNSYRHQHQPKTNGYGLFHKTASVTASNNFNNPNQDDDTPELKLTQ